MAQQVTLEEAASHLPELVREARGGQEIVFMEGQRPVARMVPVGDDLPTASEIAQLAMAGGAFAWLADEPDTYDDTSGEALHVPAFHVPALLRQWQQEYGLPPRPDGKAHTSVEELLTQWDKEDAALTPEEAEAAQCLWVEHENSHPQVSI